MRRRTAVALALATLLAGPVPAAAEPSARTPAASTRRAEESFARFARQWMRGVRELEAEERRRPRILRSARDPLVTYRGYGGDFSIEVQPTGLPDAPFVGLLRYTELLYSCSDTKATDCTVASKLPQTEIFRYQKGRWRY